MRVGATTLFVFGAAYLILITPPSAEAAPTVADYTFSGDSLSSSTNAFAIATDVTTGPGIAGETEFQTIFGSTVYDAVTSNNLPLTEAAAVSGSDYISLTITPKTGFLDYATLFFEICGGADDISNLFDGDISVRSSVDNFTSDLLTVSTGDLSAGAVNRKRGGLLPGRCGQSILRLAE